MYLEHNKRWCEYIQAQNDLREVLDEYEMIFQRTQPKVNYSERVSGTPRNCDDCLYTDTCDDKAFFYACTSKATISKMEQVEDEPQTDCAWR